MRRMHAIALVALALVAVTAMVALPAVGGTSGRGLSKHDRALLAQARAEGKSSVIVLVAAKGGAAPKAISELEGLGATIQYRDAALGYIRASIALDKVAQAVALPSVAALDVDETYDLPDPRPEGAVNPTPQPPPGPATPRANPYMPTADTGAAPFVAAHPTWDGRNVTIGIVDTGVSLDHPSLLTTSTGQPKVVDWVTGTDPANDDDPTWINMENQVTGATFSFQSVTYTAPAAGNYRIGLFDERDSRLGGELGSDVNRDGNPGGSSGIFAVLWDPSADTVWVDTNQNQSFADELSMRDYKVNHDVGYFGTDNPATAVAERLPFVVQTEGDIKWVNIGIVSGAHGSHVTGIAAGNSLFGGQMSGAAPGAKVVSVRACLFVAGCTSHALVEGMIYVAKQSNVDVINMSIGGLPSLNDGNNTRCIVYQRLIEQSNVQMFISAGNSGSGLNTVGDPSVCGDVMSVGSYISKASWQANYGSDSTFADNLHGFSSRGPREDGGFKPSFVAPGSAISSTPLWQPGGPVVGTYTLPPGYSMFNGTSMASPQSAGAAALLVSAAKAQNVQKQPAQIRQALTSSARFLPAPIGAYEQGNGIIDVGAAWNLLKTNIKTVDISSSVPVNTLITGFLATPASVAASMTARASPSGQTYTRTYTFTRNSGGGAAITYNVSWVGNDGTFSSAGTISLAKGVPTTLVVNVNPSTRGCAFGDPQPERPVDSRDRLPDDEHRRRPRTLHGREQLHGREAGTIGRNQTKSFFFKVPADTPAFKVDFSGPSATPGTGQVRFLRFHPYGVGIDSNASTAYYSPSAGSCGVPGSPAQPHDLEPDRRGLGGHGRGPADVRYGERAVHADRVDPRRQRLAEPGHDRLGDARSAGRAVVHADEPVRRLHGPGSRDTLGSAFLATPTIANLARASPTVTVTAGSTSLRATIGSPSDPAADLDLFVFNCTAGTVVLAGQSADGDSEESVTIANPAAGDWAGPRRRLRSSGRDDDVQLRRRVHERSVRSVAVTDANALRPAGASWTVPGSVTANAAPAAGRVLLGNVQVRTDTNVLVGSGDVIVQSVTP